MVYRGGSSACQSRWVRAIYRLPLCCRFSCRPLLLLRYLPIFRRFSFRVRTVLPLCAGLPPYAMSVFSSCYLLSFRFCRWRFCSALFGPGIGLVLLFSPLFIAVGVTSRSHFRRLTNRCKVGCGASSGRGVVGRGRSLAIALALRGGRRLRYTILGVFRTRRGRCVTLLPLSRGNSGASNRVCLCHFVSGKRRRRPKLRGVRRSRRFSHISTVFGR